MGQFSVGANSANSPQAALQRRQAKLEVHLGKGWRRPEGVRHATRARLIDGIFACESLRDDALAAYMQQRGLLGDLGW